MPDARYDRNNIFAKILRDEIPSARVYEDDEFVAFRDIAPAAPVHVIVIPRGEPPTSPAGLTEADTGMVGRLVLAAVRVAAEQGLADGGYRLVMNCGDHGGQSVAHLHLHVLGGGPLGPVA
ncbi:MAG: histidine triad nucleotide-binding protein [Dehalococcoidia bacterium]|nr:histidine triad nucleotide-binding protein [Dehalococcoidia bacterium]